MSDLARLPSYPSPTTLIARSGIQFLDFGFDPARLRTREWGFHDAASAKSVDDLVQLDFDEVRGQYEVVEGGRRRAAEPNLVVTAKDALAPFLDKWVPVPFLQVRPNNQFREGPADWARVRLVDLEARYGEGFRDEQGNRYRAVLAFDTGLIAEAEGRAYLAPSSKDVTAGALFALAPLRIWSAYINFCVFPMVIGMFLGETLIVRRRVLPQVKGSGLLDTVRVYFAAPH